MQHVFIVGSKGIPGEYGGFETFIEKLTEYHQINTEIRYHVACRSKEAGEYEYQRAHCFQIKVPDIGHAKAIYYDIMALRYCCRYIEINHITHPIIYILACRIGPFTAYFQQKIHKLGGRLFLNPDGHEWLRKKWSIPVRLYWKLSERMTVKRCDLLICDSMAIENYMLQTYARYKKQTTYIAYGSETRKSLLADNHEKLLGWYQELGLSAKQYYLVVGRLVPENNFETMIREFMKSNSKRDFIIIADNNIKFMKKLESRLHFRSDPRIKFAGTVYNQELLMKIRENAYGNIHGHEVGGTNPSLVEALNSTDLNLLLDVSFNREVSQNNSLYWSKEPGNLSGLIEKADAMNINEIKQLGTGAKKRVYDAYSWEHIATLYETLFLG